MAWWWTEVAWTTMLTGRPNGGSPRTDLSAMKSSVLKMRPISNIAMKAGCTLFLIAIGILVSWASVSRAAWAAPRTSDVDNVHLAVWRIVNAEHTHSATAWAAGPRKFVTNAHALTRMTQLNSRRAFLTQNWNGKPVRLTMKRILALTITYDLALVETEQPVSHFLATADTFSEKQQANLSMIGFSGTDFDTARQIGKIVYEDPLSYQVAMNKTIFGGYSGSPLLNARGQVVAVVHRAFEDTNLASAVKLTNLQAFARGNVGVGCTDLMTLEGCVQRALEHVRKMAQNGNPVAQFQLGADGPFHDDRDWLARSAEQGFAAAQYVLGVVAKRRQKWAQAARWYKLAAEQKHAVAQMALSRLHYNGIGVPKNREMVFRLVQQSAKSGLYDAQRSLGFCYYVGIGTPADREQGVYWFKAAARNGDEHSKHVLELIGRRR